MAMRLLVKQLSISAWLGAFLLFGLFTVKIYPALHVGMVSNIGDEFFTVRSVLGMLEGSSSLSLVSPRLYWAVLAPLCVLTGKSLLPAVFAARAFSVAAASLVLYLTYRLGREMADEKAGLGASLILGGAYAFFLQSRMARPEMLTLVLLVTAFSCIYHASLHERKERFLIFGGIIAVLSVTAHPNNIQHLGGFAAVYLVLFGRRLFGRSTVYFLGGLFLGGLMWLLLVYLPVRLGTSPSPEGATAVTEGVRGLGSIFPFPILQRSPLGLFKEALLRFPNDYIFDYLRYFGIFFRNTISIYYFAGIITVMLALSLFAAQRKNVLALLAFAVFSAFSNYFVVFKLGYWHAVEFYPFVALAASCGLSGLTQALDRKVRLAGRWKAGTVVFWIAVGLIFVPGLADSGSSFLRVKGYRYERVLERLAEEVPWDAKVLGMDVYEPAFRRGQLVGFWVDIDRPGRRCPDFVEALERRGVTHVLLDEGLRRFASKGCGSEYGEQILRYLFTRSRQVAVVDGYPEGWEGNRALSDVYVFEVGSGEGRTGNSQQDSQRKAEGGL
jgi:hypothetical protein